MLYGYRLKTIATVALEGSTQDAQAVHLATADGHTCSLTIAITEDHRSDISLVGRGFESHDRALQAGIAARGALRQAALAADVAVHFGDTPARGTSLSAVAKQRASEAAGGAIVIGDAHGLVVFEDTGDPLLAVGFRATGYVSRPVDKLLGALGTSLDGGRLLDGSKVSLATDMYFLADFEGSERARFLTLVTALEVAATRQPRPPQVAELVDSFQSMVREALGKVPPAEQQVRSALQSLRGGLKDLQIESIASSIRRLVEDYEILLDCGDRDATQLVRDCYKVRSTLVHSGQEPEGLRVVDLLNDLRQLVRALLRRMATIDAQ